MKVVQFKGVLVRKLSLRLLNGKDIGLNLRIIKPDNLEGREKLIMLIDKVAEEIELSDFQFYPFEKEEEGIQYISTPHYLTQVEENRFVLSCR